MNAPHLQIYPTAQAAGIALAAELRALVARQPDVVIGFPTGGTPRQLYAELARLAREDKVDWSQVRGFNLDEYWPLASEHPASFRSFMLHNLIEPAGFDADLLRIPSGEVATEEIDAHIAAYQASIREAGGIYLQLLGIGLNGHIGFNEPGSPATSRARLVELAEVTRNRARAQFGEDEVPSHGITLGIADILDAERVTVMAFGAEKAQAVCAALEGAIDSSCPASLLRRHPNVTWMLDTEAAQELGMFN